MSQLFAPNGDLLLPDTEVTPKSRYHAKVRSPQVEVNLFEDDLDDLFTQVKAILVCLEELQPVKGLRDLKEENAGLKETPTCCSCGTKEAMELISFTDKETGLEKKAWKCQACRKWRW